MSSNKRAKEKLIQMYGAECFIEKLKLRKDTKPRKYKGKSQMKKMKQLTYHHIRMKKDGGKATIENHAWFHKQTPENQTMMNNMFQEYKRNYQECKVVFVDELDFPFEIKATEFHIDEREQKKVKYNRAKEKRELQKQIDDELDR